MTICEAFRNSYLKFKEQENKVCFEVHIDYAKNPDTLAMIQQVTDEYQS